MDAPCETALFAGHNEMRATCHPDSAARRASRLAPARGQARNQHHAGAGGAIPTRLGAGAGGRSAQHDRRTGDHRGALRGNPRPAPRSAIIDQVSQAQFESEIDQYEPEIASPARRRRHPCPSIASDRQEALLVAHQSDDLRAAVILWRRRGAAGGVRADRQRSRGGKAPACSLARGGRALLGSGYQIAKPGYAGEPPTRRTPHRRGLPSEGGLDRQRTHADPRRRRQGREGSLRDAVAATTPYSAPIGKRARPGLWLFPGRESGDHVSIPALQDTRRVARRKVMLGKPLTALRRRQKLPNQNRRTSYRPRIKSADAHGGREHDARFSSMLGSRPSAPEKLAARINSGSHDGQNSLVAAKNAGNFPESAFFRENLSRKRLRIQWFAYEFPTQRSREFFCQRRELIREQGMSR